VDDSSKDKITQGCPFFGLYNLNLILHPYSFPKTVKIWANFFRLKTLNNGMLKTKLPLIIIIAL